MVKLNHYVSMSHIYGSEGFGVIKMESKRVEDDRVRSWKNRASRKILRINRQDPLGYRLYLMKKGLKTKIEAIILR